MSNELDVAWSAYLKLNTRNETFLALAAFLFENDQSLTVEADFEIFAET